MKVKIIKEYPGSFNIGDCIEVESDWIEKYKHLHSPVYPTKDGEAGLGEIVWREKQGIPKQVEFNLAHINNKTPVFVKEENCIEYIKSLVSLKDKTDSVNNRMKIVSYLEGYLNNLKDVNKVTPEYIESQLKEMRISLNNLKEII